MNATLIQTDVCDFLADQRVEFEEMKRVPADSGDGFDAGWRTAR